MSKNVKKTNPYEKKNKRSLKISRKQWIAIICVVSVAAIIGGIVLGNKLFNSDPHAGHDHGDLPEGHYEGDGHDHSSTPTTGHSEGDGHSHSTPSTNGDKVKYQMYTNADKTYRLVFRDNAGKAVAEFDKIPKQPSKAPINADKGVYELGWATDSGANDYECVYYNVKTGQVSQKFVAPRGSDGVRIAYGSEDQTKVIVQDLFNKNAYYKEHALDSAYTKADDIIRGGKLHANKKTVVISYVINEKGEQRHASIDLYA